MPYDVPLSNMNILLLVSKISHFLNDRDLSFRYL